MTNHENSTSRKKFRRGNRNIDKRKARYEQWKTLRRNNRRHWRQIKQNGSTALRNLVATSLLYPATQELYKIQNAKRRKRQKQYSQMKKQRLSFHTPPEQDFQPPDSAP